MLLFHVAECCLASVDNRFKADSGHEIDFLVIVLVTLFKAGGSYIVNPDINAAKTLIDMSCESVVAFCLGNIESFIINFAILRKLFGCFLQFLFVAGTDGNLGSLFEKCFRCCEADAFAASGYND